MKETPLLFTAEMVRAILEGRKTQTRRIGRHQDARCTELDVEYFLHATKGYEATATYRAFPNGGTARWAIEACPHGKPGDALWVRETWAAERVFDCRKPSQISPTSRVHFLADGPKPKWAGKTRVSIFMPKWASRLTLEITKVRVERLVEISDEDAKAEGMQPVLGPNNPHIFHFEQTWNSIHGPYAFGKNPWVWVIEFKKKEAA